MATRRLAGALNRHFRSILPSTASAALATKTSRTLSLLSPDLLTIAAWRVDPVIFASGRGFSSRASNSSGEDEDDDDDDEEDDEDDEDDEEDEVEVEDGERLSGPVSKYGSGKSEEEKALEAAEIGYKVIGPLDSSEKPFKPYEPVFAVVQIGSHQFKVSNGDSIFTERLKFCDVNDKLVLSKVLMLGSKTQTIIGRPILPEASVHAVVEEHALDAKVIIFKKKRRKNYRRTKGHRQELTKLRITDIQGMDKSENITVAA